MTQASYSVTIGRSARDVFSFLADGQNCPKWRPGVVDIRLLSGDGIGARYAQRVRGPMGRPVAADYTVTVYDPDRMLEFQTTTGPVRPHGRYELLDMVGGTRVTFALDAKLSGLNRLVMGRMVQRTMESEVRNLDNLKRILEV